MSAKTLQKIFDETSGLDPVFNLLDADRPDAFPSMDALRAATVEQRRAVFTMLLQGKFTRRITLPASREHDVVAFHGPFGVSTATGGDLHAGLANQAPLRSGAWSDVDRFDVPSLRGVGSRGGYLHNGIAKTLAEVVEHYERVLNFGFTAQSVNKMVVTSATVKPCWAASARGTIVACVQLFVRRAAGNSPGYSA